jgi:hypothetical protein
LSASWASRNRAYQSSIIPVAVPSCTSHRLATSVEAPALKKPRARPTSSSASRGLAGAQVDDGAVKIQLQNVGGRRPTVVQPERGEHGIIRAEHAVACQLQDAATGGLLSDGTRGRPPVGQNFGAGEVRGYGAGLVGHVRYQGGRIRSLPRPCPGSANLSPGRERRHRSVGPDRTVRAGRRAGDPEELYLVHDREGDSTFESTRSAPAARADRWSAESGVSFRTRSEASGLFMRTSTISSVLAPSGR